MEYILFQNYYLCISITGDIDNINSYFEFLSQKFCLKHQHNQDGSTNIMECTASGSIILRPEDTLQYKVTLQWHLTLFFIQIL